MTGIRSIAYALPEGIVSNIDLERENPGWGMESVAKRTGIVSRRVAAPQETALDLSVRACDALISETDVDLGTVDAIVYCTQTPDYAMPGNAHVLHRELGLGDDVLAFDYALACSGYVYGLAFADSFIRSGLASDVLVVTAETYSKRIHPQDRSARALFGDAAAVTHVSAAGDGGGRIVAARLCSHGSHFERVYIPAGGARIPYSDETAREVTDPSGNKRSGETIQMDGAAVWAFVNSAVPRHVRAFLAEQSLTVDDIDVCVFHQASKLTLDSLAKGLELKREKMYECMAETGNLSSSSIPVALRSALDDGTIQAGHRVLLCGFGAGLSYGSVLVEF